MTSKRALLVAGPRRDDDRIELSVVIPAYNEAFRLPVALEALRHHVDLARTEIIVVDDGSADETAEVAERASDWAPLLVVVRHEHNQGKGAAVRTGVGRARGRVIAFIDADNATDLDALGPMVAALGPTVCAVFGSRHVPGSTVTGSPAIRGVMGRVFNHVVKFAAGTAIRDTQCGAKVFRASAARLAFAGSSIDGWAFDVEVLRRLLSMGCGVIEYPVNWHYVHGTKIRFTTPLRMLRDIARIRLVRGPVPPRHIDTVYHPSLASMVDPVGEGVVMTDGVPCRIVVPFETVGPVREQLVALGLPSTVTQGRSWSFED